MNVHWAHSPCVSVLQPLRYQPSGHASSPLHSLQLKASVLP